MAAELTPKQRTFVDEYLLDLNAKQAAIRAGYSPKTAEQQGSRLLRNAQVAAAVKAAIEARAARTAVDAEWVVEKLVENLARAMQAKPVYDREGNPTGEYTYHGTVANGALRLLGLHLGMYKRELDVRVSGGLTIDRLYELASAAEHDDD